MTHLTTDKIWVVLMAFDSSRNNIIITKLNFKMGIFKHQLLELLIAFNIYKNCSLSNNLETSFELIFGDSMKALSGQNCHLKDKKF